jgi:anti-sigma B factor antagonist
LRAQMMDAARFSCETLDDTIGVIAVDGELDLSNARVLDGHVDDLARERASGVLIDLTGTLYVDSTALAAFLNIRQRLSTLGAGLALVITSPHLKRTLEIRGLDSLFQIVGTRDDGLATLRRARPV